MVLTGGAEATAGQGQIFYVKSATAALTITAVKLGTGAIIRKFVNIPAGFKFKAAPEAVGWDYLRITSASSQTIELIVGDDDVDVANAVSVTGSVTTQEQPSSAIATPARVTRATGGATTIAANPARRRITIANPSDNATPGLLYIQAVGAGAGRGIPLDSGLFVELRTTAAIDVRNDSGVSVDFTQFEET